MPAFGGSIKQAFDWRPIVLPAAGNERREGDVPRSGDLQFDPIASSAEDGCVPQPDTAY